MVDVVAGAEDPNGEAEEPNENPKEGAEAEEIVVVVVAAEAADENPKEGVEAEEVVVLVEEGTNPKEGV
ncbi:hypothetical protein ACFX15_013229 [Malus domestica]